MRFLGLTLVFSLVGFSSVAFGENEHSVVRRITVFPMKAPKELAPQAEEAWWTVREALTENQRFLVASRNFLAQRDVLQARAELKPADVVILGKLLDANAIVTLFLEGRVFSMRVYESEYGRLLWTQDYNLHPSLPLTEQLQGTARKLVYDFISSIPYQGFVVVDPLKRSATYAEGSSVRTKVHVGLNAAVEVGDTVQFFRLYHDSVKPLFTPETSLEIFGEGKVLAIDGEMAIVELERLAKQTTLKDFTLVRLPKEFQRLRDTYALGNTIKGAVGTEYYSPEVTPVQEEVAERKPLVASLLYILNMAAFLLLAF